MYLIRERFFRSDEHSNITDDQGRPVLQVDAKALSLRNRLVLRDPKGKEVAQVRRTLAAHRPTYEVSVDGQEAPEIRKHLVTPFGDRFSIDLPGPDELEVRGNFGVEVFDGATAPAPERHSALPSRLRGREHPADGGREAVPLAGLAGELLAAGGRQLVVASLAVVF